MARSSFPYDSTNQNGPTKRSLLYNLCFLLADKTLVYQLFFD